MNFGWTVDHILKMPASRFFAIAKAGREIYDQRANINYFQLCSVAAVASQDSKYFETLTAAYYARAFPEIRAEVPRGPAFDISDKKQGTAALMNLAMMMRGGGKRA